MTAATPKVSLITGAASDIGASIAAALSERGDVVHLNDLDAERLAAVRDGLPGEAHLAVADVSDAGAVAAMVEAVVARHGRLDVLVCSAALSGQAVLADVLDLTPEAWRRTMAVNLDGVFHCAQAAARVMVAQGAGTIVNVASVSGIVAERHAAAYSASKAGVIGLTRALALDLAEAGVRVCAVAPGDIATRTSDAAAASRPPDGGRTTPLGRGTPRDVAGCVRFLSGPDAGFVTGTTLVVDGGLLAC